MRLFRQFIRVFWQRKKLYFIIIGIIFFFLWTQPRLPSSGTLKIYDKNKVLLFELAGNTGRKETISFSRFPNYLTEAVMASEDENYWQHAGVDVKAVARSLLLNIRSGKVVSGASTIPQQVVRLNTGSSSFLPLRIVNKLREICMAIRLSLTHSKQDIMTIYLNNVYLGYQNYGFQSAAQFYFHKNVDKLSLSESAYLVGMISSPGYYDPYHNRVEGDKRKKYVLGRMRTLGLISSEQQQTAQESKVAFSSPKTSIQAPHFVDYIIAQLPTLHVPSENISVYTTIDVDTYMLSQRIAADWVERLKERFNVHNASMIVLDNKTGAILSMLGGIDYFDTPNDGQVNMVTALRQPGSAIKPITYTAAFLKGYTPATLLYDVKKSFITKRGEGFIPNNFGDKYHGLVLAREALASSYNLPAVEMLDKAGIPLFVTTARTLGITTFTTEEEYDYSVTLGAKEVKLLDLANVYATLARKGNYLSPYGIDHIDDTNGRTIYSHPSQNPEQKLGTNGEQISFLITDILSDPEARMPGFGEKNYLTMSRPAAVKTGTTTDWHDIWTVGYTPSYTVGVWMGNNNNDAMRNISSATGAAPVWNQFFEEFLKDKPVEEFKRPNKIIEKEICAASGELPDDLCPERKSELFISGTEPKNKSKLHRAVKVDMRNNLLANRCPPELIKERVMIDYPLEVYSWALSTGKPVIPTEYSPLCGEDRPVITSRLFISITNPKQKAVFQNAPLLIRNQGITFEVNVSSGIEEVVWYVDNKNFSEEITPPFSTVYPLKTGTHIIYAEGIGSSDRVMSEKITFQVVEY